MKFYIVDDDPSIPLILRQIIEKDPDNIVVGIANDSQKALHDAMIMDIDILLADLLMPEMSGIKLIKTLKSAKPQLKFVMISQVKDSDLRAEAYQAGIEFFIDKPINVIEVKTVLERVSQNIAMANKLSNIQSLVGDIVSPNPTVDQHKENRAKMLSILRFLGITSEAGSSDILSITQLMLDKGISFREIDFITEYHIDMREKKILFQRIRRAIKTGLTNLANLCLDDLGDELVVEYANTLYEYKNVHNEIHFLNGKRNTGGKISLKHFFDGLVTLI